MRRWPPALMCYDDQARLTNVKIIGRRCVAMQVRISKRF